jgi:hypothetical protein
MVLYNIIEWKRLIKGISEKQILTISVNLNGHTTLDESLFSEIT